MRNVKCLSYFVGFQLLCTFLKIPYFDAMKAQTIWNEVEHLYLYMSSNIVMSLLWLLQTLVIILFTIKTVLLELNTFEHRYANRTLYYIAICKRFLVSTLFMGVVSCLLQYGIFVYIENIDVNIGAFLIIAGAYLVFLLLSDVLILLVAQYTHNDALAVFLWIVAMNILSIGSTFFQIDLVLLLHNQFVVLAMLVIIGVCMKCMYQVFRKKDFGGNEYEARS